MGSGSLFWTLGCWLPLNLSFNVSLLFLLASPGGALLVYVALKLQVALSSLLAWGLPWPSELGPQSVSGLEMLGGLIVIAATVLFLIGGRQRGRLERGEVTPVGL